MKTYYVYIMASEGPTLYVGVTNDLLRRVFEHREGLVLGFSKKYSVTKLVYYEETTDIESAIRREKRLKHWNRQWKLDLIRESNPEFRDLYPELAGSSDQVGG